jgi:hypothetical protein
VHSRRGLQAKVFALAIERAGVDAEDSHKGGNFLSRLGWGRNSETLAQHNRDLGVAAAGAVKANSSACQRDAQLSRQRLHHGVALIAGLVQNQKIIGVGSVFVVRSTAPSVLRTLIAA